MCCPLVMLYHMSMTLMPECRASATSHALAWLLFCETAFFSANCAQLPAYALIVWWCWSKQLLISYFCLATPVSICYEFPKEYFGNQVIVNTSWHCHNDHHSVFYYTCVKTFKELKMPVRNAEKFKEFHYCHSPTWSNSVLLQGGWGELLPHATFRISGFYV